MFHAIVIARVRRLWRKIGNGDYGAAVDSASSDIDFTFVGDVPIGGTVHGRDQFEAWFKQLYEVFPDIRMNVEDITAAGPPWNTRVAVRLTISATLKDGSQYTNHAVQWITLRWGKMTKDWVIEDTLKLSRVFDTHLDHRDETPRSKSLK
jgi:ketosteroid isomerase-like protein